MNTAARNQKVTLTAIPAMLVALAACGASNASSQAESLREVNAIYVVGERCTSGVSNALAEYDVGVTIHRDIADSLLKLSVNTEGRNLDEIPEFGGFGHKASYSASLVGAGGKVLFSTSGEEGSTTYEELCEDIGDEIAARIEDRRET